MTYAASLPGSDAYSSAWVSRPTSGVQLHFELVHFRVLHDLRHRQTQAIF